MEANLKNILESILFVSNRPQSSHSLSKYTGASVEDIETSLLELLEERKNSGIVLITNGTDYSLATNPGNSEHVRNFLNSDLKEKLSDASLEVFTIIAYKGLISKGDIETIRGVNSQFSIRQLLMRGMIEKFSEDNTRGVNYRLTTDSLAHLGISKIEDLPDYKKILESLTPPGEKKTTSHDESLESIN